MAGGRWELIPERAAALQQAVEMWRAGQGLGAIARALHAAGLQTSDAAPTSSHLSRLLTHPAIVGDKLVSLDGETHTLADYYPAIISREVYAELLDLARMQGRQLVADTFARIVVWHHGQDPETTPRGTVDVLLVARGGIGRLLRVDAAGDLVASDEVDEDAVGG